MTKSTRSQRQLHSRGRRHPNVQNTSVYTCVIVMSYHLKCDQQVSIHSSRCLCISLTLKNFITVEQVESRNSQIDVFELHLSALDFRCSRGQDILCFSKLYSAISSVGFNSLISFLFWLFLCLDCSMSPGFLAFSVAGSRQQISVCFGHDLHSLPCVAPGHRCQHAEQQYA